MVRLLDNTFSGKNKCCVGHIISDKECTNLLSPLIRMENKHWQVCVSFNCTCQRIQSGKQFNFFG